MSATRSPFFSARAAITCSGFWNSARSGRSSMARYPSSLSIFHERIPPVSAAFFSEA